MNTYLNLSPQFLSVQDFLFLIGEINLKAIFENFESPEILFLIKHAIIEIKQNRIECK